MAGISETVVSIKPGNMEEVNKYIDSQLGLLSTIDDMMGFAVAATKKRILTTAELVESEITDVRLGDFVELGVEP